MNFLDELDELKDKLAYDKLEKDSENYYEIRNKIKLVIRCLRNSLSDLNSVSKKVIDGYSVDGESGDNYFLENTRKKIKSTCDYLSYTILPNIEKKIKDVNKQIEEFDLEQEDL